MANFEAKNIRNIVFLGHSGSGKTTLAEALLYTGGVIPKVGSVTEGTTVSDYNEDEKEKKCSLGSSLMTITTGSMKINMLDTPGYTDFIGEAIGALEAVDAGMIVVNAQAGIEIGAERGYKLLKAKGIPSVFFVNRLDKEHADFDKCVEAISKKVGKGCAVITYPAGKETAFKGVVNLLNKTSVENLPEEDKTKAKRALDSLAEAVAETDDALLEKYLEKGELSAEELSGALRKAVIELKITPVLCGCAASSIGVKELLEFIAKYLPSPADKGAVEALKGDGSEKIAVEPNANKPFSALIFKTLSDPYLGQISIFKIFSGRLQSNTGFFNVTKGVREKIGPLFSLLGKSQIPMEAAQAGDIVCVSKLKETSTGDSLSDEKNQIRFGDIPFPEPAISFSLKPKTRSDEDKISNALHKLTAEDPTFKIIRDEETKELVASGMGDMHINMMINRMKTRYGVQVDLGTPKVAYKETITANGDAQYRHKKQTGGAGQFAEVWMKIEPLARGTGFEFVDEVVGGAIPRPFIVSCEKGVKSAMKNGCLAGFPVVDVRAIVYDGKTHPVDSKDIAFQIAARQGFKEACLKARPVILEPIMDVDVVVPDEFMGDITGSLNSRRGRVMGMEPGDGVQTIKAKVPLEEMYKYVNELKSITGGRGTYTMSFSHYEVVPSNLAQVIIEKAKQVKKEETEE
jgi:elongation factor G